MTMDKLGGLLEEAMRTHDGDRSRQDGSSGEGQRSRARAQKPVARESPVSIEGSPDVRYLQRVVGNQAVADLVTGRATWPAHDEPALQRRPAPPAVAHHPKKLSQADEIAGADNFEGLCDAVGSRFQRLIDKQQDGADELVSQASKKEKPSVAIVILEACALGAVAAATAGVGELVAAELIVAEETIGKEVLKEVIKMSVESSLDEGIKGIKDYRDEESKSVIERFADMQKALIRKTAWGAQDYFNLQKRKELVVRHKHNPKAASRTLEWMMKAMDQQIENAGKVQYKHSLDQWAVYQAKAGYGTDETDAEHGTDLSKMTEKDPVNGVLDLLGAVDPDNPAATPNLFRAQIGGLKPKMIEAIKEQPINDLKIPVVARFSTTGGLRFDLTIAKNEMGEVRVTGAPDALVWLRDRFWPRPQLHHGVARKPPKNANFPNIELGLEYQRTGLAHRDGKAFFENEIGTRSLAQLGVYLLD